MKIMTNNENNNEQTMKIMKHRGKTMKKPRKHN